MTLMEAAIAASSGLGEGPQWAVDVDLRGPVLAMHAALPRDGLESPLTVIQHVDTRDGESAFDWRQGFCLSRGE